MLDGFGNEVILVLGFIFEKKLNILDLGISKFLLLCRIFWSGSGLSFMFDISELLVELFVVIVLLLFELFRLSMFELNLLSISFFFISWKFFIGKDYGKKFIVLCECFFYVL